MIPVATKPYQGSLVDELFTRAYYLHHPADHVKWMIADITGTRLPDADALTRAVNTDYTSVDFITDMGARFTALSDTEWWNYREIERKRLTLAIHGLGENSDTIAESLKKLGILGVRGESCACPLYRWLSSYYGAWSAHVGHTHIVCDGIEVSVSVAVQAFVSRFDTRQFPELDLMPDYAGSL